MPSFRVESQVYVVVHVFPFCVSFRFRRWGVSKRPVGPHGRRAAPKSQHSTVHALSTHECCMYLYVDSYLMEMRGPGDAGPARFFTYNDLRLATRFRFGEIFCRTKPHNIQAPPYINY